MVGLALHSKRFSKAGTRKMTNLYQAHAERLNDIAERIHKANHKWWVDINTGVPKERNVGEMLMLMVSELAEAMEGHRKGLMDDKLPHRKMMEVELADCIIRILDCAHGLGMDIGGALMEKHQYN